MASVQQQHVFLCIFVLLDVSLHHPCLCGSAAWAAWGLGQQATDSQSIEMFAAESHLFLRVLCQYSSCRNLWGFPLFMYHCTVERFQKLLWQDLLLLLARSKNMAMKVQHPRLQHPCFELARTKNPPSTTDIMAWIEQAIMNPNVQADTGSNPQCYGVLAIHLVVLRALVSS